MGDILKLLSWSQVCSFGRFFMAKFHFSG
jgi:hypothetical protein